ncbi:protein tweety-like isoform X2 [Daktulosphaira vitifoliae]|uniref:protein tweety-like isoform X2 n=1 Tax=Daktulosphaira vitifoliae TaxID=58002 RepID=UPI0021A987F9|nr:protein tweety-like isoform X2 [Daktulosphaira vitifoliae]XP_050523405.1 protein tweety-like isoform X2 [Daktulosphaira vitifoliae]
MARMIQENVVTYKTPLLAHIFHSFPHLNVSGHIVSSGFAPHSALYHESLGILGSVPSVWLIITLFLLLIYLMTRCCDRKPRPRHSIVVLKWTLAIFTVLSCGAVGVSLYGNDDLHNGITQFITSTKALNDIVLSVKNQTSAIEILLQVNIHDKLSDLGDIIDSPVANQTARGQIVTALSTLVGNAASTLSNIRGISNSLRGVNLTPFVNNVELMESIRSPVTIAVLSILLVFCFILLFGVARHSRCALIMFSVFGLFAVIISWLSASIYLTGAVAMGDFCINPNEWLERDWAPPTFLKLEILTFYTTCEGSNNPTGSTRSNPFGLAIRQASSSVDATNYQLEIVTRLAKTLYPTSNTREDMPILLNRMRMDVESAARMVSALPASLECRQVHLHYNRALHASCDLALFGLALMLLASVISGLFFTILVWLDFHTWIYIRKKQDYVKTEERDPFLGRPGSTASSSQSHGHQMSTLTRNQGLYYYPLFISHPTPAQHAQNCSA